MIPAVNLEPWNQNSSILFLIYSKGRNINFYHDHHLLIVLEKGSLFRERGLFVIDGDLLSICQLLFLKSNIFCYPIHRSYDLKHINKYL